MEPTTLNLSYRAPRAGAFNPIVAFLSIGLVMGKDDTTAPTDASKP